MKKHNLYFETQNPKHPYGKVIVRTCREGEFCNFREIAQIDSLWFRDNLDLQLTEEELLTGVHFWPFVSWSGIPPRFYSGAIALTCELFNKLELKNGPRLGAWEKGPWQNDEGSWVIINLSKMLTVIRLMNEAGLRPDSGSIKMELTYVGGPIWEHIAWAALRAVPDLEETRQKVAAGVTIAWAI